LDGCDDGVEISSVSHLLPRLFGPADASLSVAAVAPHHRPREVPIMPDRRDLKMQTTR
jgi:hypothetical protein